MIEIIQIELYKYGYATSYFSRYFPFTTHVLQTNNLTKQLKNLLHKWNYSTKINEVPENTSDKSISTSLSQKLHEQVLQREQGIIKYLNL